MDEVSACLEVLTAFLEDFSFLRNSIKCKWLVRTFGYYMYDVSVKTEDVRLMYIPLHPTFKK